ncbi:Nonribosomal peptide synthase sidE [Fusarium oxysporum f. sp. rapae]|uniref:Nonribosomal peptide synthase sidE n=1 Tax=Fusarium oxysporum f. sp. rapae TaxID=485398 RepID=A0A8J5NG83_FUSOX|nr:Nonribosomal peptide synthase sidE [Fusarium oxysporum f. sp. rapae]
MSVVASQLQAIPLHFPSGPKDEILTTVEPPEPPAAPCVVTDFIEHQSLVNPNASAVQIEHQQPVSYGTLWELVETLVASLKFQANTIVPICMELSVEYVATILAILKAGAAYVLLDPESSAKRNRIIVKDCGADFVVVHPRYSHLFTKFEIFEHILSAGAAGRQLSPRAEPTPADLAYIIYTSGSTGKPKGVCLSHGSVTLGISHFSLNGYKRWLLFYNPVFSAAQRTILATLSHGGCLCLAPRNRLATALPEVLVNLQIEALGITPSALSLLSPSGIPASLRQITTVGEPLSQMLVDQFATRVDLRVSYGLSECAQLNFSRLLRPGDNPRNVGRPTDTSTAVILEPETDVQASEGGSGELCLYGPQIAGGYHGLVSETHRRFTQNPYGLGLLFRTGDHAVKHSDGTIEILGRLDYQVKIHGQRVEPQEIGTQLALEEDASAVACFGAQIQGRTSLVGAAVPKDGVDWSQLVNTLRLKARNSFPRYMVPGYWLRIDKLPVNQNGKVDLAKLRAIAESTPLEQLLNREASSNNVESISEEIAKIRDIWAKLLNLPQSLIQPSDSFTSLGGSSLEAIQAIRQLKTDGIHLHLSDMLQSQTLEQVSEISRTNHENETSVTDVPPFSLLPASYPVAELAFDRGVSDAFPATALQTGILASTIQGNKNYLYQRLYDVRHLDLIRLELAFRIAFTRSDTLRSTFLTSLAGFIQVVRNDWVLPWKAEYVSTKEYVAKDRERGVEFGQPFVRACVLNRNVLVVSVHHALFDYWSHVFLFEDVASLYFGLQPIDRSPWRSYIHALQRQSQEDAKAFWSGHLSRATKTQLITSPTAASSSVSRTLSIDTKSATQLLQTTPGAIFYTAWAWVLSRHTGSPTVTMAIALSGRDIHVPGIERLDGPTLAIVPQLVEIPDNKPLQDTVKAVNDQVWEMVRHSHVGIQGALAASDHHDSKLFDTMVNILAREQEPNDMTRQTFQEFGRRPAWKTEYTTLNVQITSDGAELTLTGPAEPQRLGFILEQFSQAVKHILLNPQGAASSLNIIGSKERAILLERSPTVSLPKTLHGQFEKVAQEHASRLAINYQNETLWTYSELDQKANQLAHHLAASGVNQGDMVPLLLSKSPFMILSILSVFKLGASYVPLSPDNPVERNSFIVQDVGGKLVLTETAYSEYFTDTPNILADTVNLEAYPTSKVTSAVSPNQLAYILYTSGSTGQPKGVMVSHKSCAAAMESIIAFENKTHGNFRTLQFSNYIFDVSLYDFFVTLHSGATLCVVPTDRLLDDLAGCINELSVDHVFLTPTVARLLDPEGVPTLNSITVGGEQLTRDVIDTWASKAKLRNGYGPTEASVLVTMKDVEPSTKGGIIGQPLQSIAAVILDPHSSQLTPYGAVGELCFWGPQLAEGYLKRPDATEKVFINAVALNGERIYRSGDLARFLPGHDIECLGRIDDQVKVNGYRIELGEVEQAILRTGEVKDCVMAVWKQGDAAHLVGCVVFVDDYPTKGEATLGDFQDNVRRLKDKCKGLASYMIPKALIPFRAMPLLPSGKTDRKRLKAIVADLKLADLTTNAFDRTDAAEAGQVTPPKTSKEKLLYEAWKQMLHLEDRPFGLESSFLSLGGDSIAAINLVSYLRKVGAKLTVGEVLRFPILGAMAERLELEGGDSTGTEPVVEFQTPSEIQSSIGSSGLLEEQVEYVYPCPPGQAEFLTQGAREESFWSLMTLRSLGKASKTEEWIGLVRKLTETNDILRTTFTRHQDTWYGVVLKVASPVVAIHYIQTAAEEQEFKERVWNQRFVFGRPFIRYDILHYSDGEQKVLIKLDHGLYDGTLLRILGGHFEAFQQNQPLEQFTSFRDYSFHIWRSDQQRTLDFWKQSTKRPILFDFPITSNQPKVKKKALRVTTVDIGPLARLSGATISIIFQSVFQLWLSIRSGEQDVAFDYL